MTPRPLPIDGNSDSPRMTPADFKRRMHDITHPWPECYDREMMHKDADDLICELLDSLGYNEGADLFREMEKWYA